MTEPPTELPPEPPAPCPLELPPGRREVDGEAFEAFWLVERVDRRELVG